jgi:hypothetical protein
MKKIQFSPSDEQMAAFIANQKQQLQEKFDNDSRALKEKYETALAAIKSDSADYVVNIVKKAKTDKKAPEKKSK